MAALITTKDMLTRRWDYNAQTSAPQSMPTIHWHYYRELEINEVQEWEEIYYMPGDLGIYAAWTPCAEYYAIVYDLISDKEHSVETFYGVNAGQTVWKRAKELGINLDLNKIWVDPQNTWLTTTNS